MEILNNIWNFMNTPNQAFIDWMGIPILLFIEMPLIMYMFIYALNIKATKKQKLSYVFAMTIIIFLSSIIIPSPFNILLNYGLMVFIIYKIFKLTKLKSFIAMLIPTIIYALISIILETPFMNLFNISQSDITLIPLYRFGYSLILYFILFIIDLILKYRNFSFVFFEELDKKSKVILYANLGFGLLEITSQLFITFYYLSSLPKIITFISFLSLFAYLGISIYSLTRVMKLALKTQELESAEAYNKSLSILHDNVRGFKHDFDNIVATIGGYVKTDDVEGLKKYYYQLEDDCQRVNNIAALNPNLINNPGIFNLLSSKYHEADSKNIKINLEIFLDLNTLNIKIYEFSRILGILLDNAIEEAEKCEEKIINIKFRNETNQNKNVIIIENTYTNKDVDIVEIFNKGISGKEKHSGLGLWEVKQILKKNSNLNLHTNKDDKFFTQQLEIYYK